MPLKQFISVATFVAVTSLAASPASAGITIPTVTIGNPGNSADPQTGNRWGAVAYTYKISKF